MGPVHAFLSLGGEDVDSQLLFVGVVVASASAVVLRMAWRGRSRKAAPPLPAANMVAQPVNAHVSDMGWLLRMDPEMAYALLELGRALDKTTDAHSANYTSGMVRFTGPSIVRGLALRAMMRPRPAERPATTTAHARAPPDAL